MTCLIDLTHWLLTDAEVILQVYSSNSFLELTSWKLELILNVCHGTSLMMYQNWFSVPWYWSRHPGVIRCQHQETLHWRHNGRDCVPNYQPHDCLHQRKHQSFASLAFVWGIYRGPVNSPHKWPATRYMFPFDDVIVKLKRWCLNKMSADLQSAWKKCKYLIPILLTLLSLLFLFIWLGFVVVFIIIFFIFVLLVCFVLFLFCFCLGGGGGGGGGGGHGSN